MKRINEVLQKITNDIKHHRTLYKDEDVSHFYPLYKVKRNNKLFFTFRDTTPRSFLNELNIKAWSSECLRTIEKLPQLPTPFSASQKAKEWGVSHVTAKRRLLEENYKYIQLSSKYFIENPKCSYHLFTVIITSEQPVSLISNINKIRTAVKNKKIKNPIYAQIKKYCDIQILTKHQVLKKIRVPLTRIYYYYVPSFFILW